ncbi:hypothetical protein [Streptomyces erythrochromogenes]|uniref:hypothetical protein n=1 Tax=Streptomyces erythrochromogenes TaxID=285574 RepID=UPI0033E93F0F
MSRPRLFGCAVLAVLAVLLGVTAPAAAGPFLPDAAPVAARAGFTGAAAPAAARSLQAPHADPVAGGGGPSCAPAAPDHGGTPVVPARSGGDHAQAPPGRPVPPAAQPYAGLPVRVPVRDPDRPAPGPVELSVMRV